MNPTITRNTGALRAGLVENNKATPAGHTAVAAGARPGASPLSPPANFLNGFGRSVTLKIRLTQEENEKFLTMLPPTKTRKRGISKFVRERIFSARRSTSASIHSALYRNLAGIKSELHQIARIANRISNPLTLVEVLAHLASLDREICKLTRAANGKAKS
jgi:hypothetical protein